MSKHLLKPLSLVLSVSAGTFLVVAGYVQALRLPDPAEARSTHQECAQPATGLPADGASARCTPHELEPAAADPAERRPRGRT